jgi:F-type H+-transporting ATPase subunit gamma
MQITKAMELVATSKLRRAKERAERSRPYYEMLNDTLGSIGASLSDRTSPWFKERRGKTLFVVIAGDRGLAGGYNANVFRLTASLAKESDPIYLPIGRKAQEYYRHRGCESISDSFPFTADIGVGEALCMAKTLTESFLTGEVSRVVLVYTRFTSMMTQTPKAMKLLPLSSDTVDISDPIVCGDPEELMATALPAYVGGTLWCTVCESVASESGARRTAMNAANKNASEMIDSLQLTYNRARQAVITQEITEIVSGAEAL